MHTDFSTHRGLLLIGLIAGAALIAACGGSTQEQTAIGTGAVTLSWDAPADPVTGYRVYYGTRSRNYNQAFGDGEFVATTTHVVTGLQSGRTYYFAVTATDASGAQSGFSNEASAAIP